MPYKVSETTDKAAMTAPRPMGPGVAQAIADRVARMEVWGSAFTDPGDDYCEFRLFDATGTLFDRVRVPGY